MCVTTGADNLEVGEETEAPLVALDTNGMSFNSARDGNSSGLSSIDDEEDEVQGRRRCKASSDGFNKVKVMCSYGGRILPRRDGQLGYVGGETRILVVNKEVRFSSLMDKLARMVGKAKKSFVLKYQLPNEDLDALISVSSDEDVVNMMDEYSKAFVSKSPTEAKLRAFLFFIPSAESGSPGPLKDSLSVLKSSPPKDASSLHRRRPIYENAARCQLRWNLEHQQRFKQRQQHDPMDPTQGSMEPTAGTDYYTHPQQQDPAPPSVNPHGSAYYPCKLPLQHPLATLGYYSRHHHFQEGMINTVSHHHGYYEPAQHQHKYMSDSPPPFYHHHYRC